MPPFLDDYTYTPQIAPRYKPTFEAHYRDYPVTLDEDRDQQGRKVIRACAWMRGQERKTPPLLEETFSEADFYDLAHQAASRSSSMVLYGNQAPGITEAFLTWWGDKNYRTMLKEHDKREREFSVSPWLDPFSRPDDPIDFTSWRGEDGRTYSRPLPNKAAAERRVQSQLESLEGFGSF